MSGNEQAIQATLFAAIPTTEKIRADKKYAPPGKTLDKKFKKVQGQLFNTETGHFVCPDCNNDVGIGWVIKGIAYCSKDGPKHLSQKGKKHWGLN